MLPLSFLRAHGRLLAFGFFMCFCSSLGQTFFIALFGGEIRRSFGLSDGDFGAIYSAGTLISAAVLVWLGRLIDRLPLAVFAAATLVGLAAMCLFMGMAGSLAGGLGTAGWGAAILLPAIFGLRLFGQGLSSHAAIVAMGRYFTAERGRVVSLASLGHTLGDAVLPGLVVAALTIAAWQDIWTGAGLALLALTPIVFILLKGQRARDAALSSARTAGGSGTAAQDWRLAAVLRDPGLWLRLPALLAPSFIFTGLIFHQVHLAETKGWPLSLLAGSYLVFAFASLAALMVGGLLVDRFSARRLVTLFLAPLALACLVLVSSDAVITAPLFLGLMGMNAGIAGVILGALWAELYGVTHLGAIRSFGQAAMVFSSGLAPAFMGLLIDQGVAMESIAAGSALYCLAAAALARLAEQSRRVTPQAG
ncbi:MFS transporter [Pelagibius litoralis]|uniref:MFS transporter n=1 Tax=Pelagibius litoralis TaxID=374515 RepID=A0A967EVG9_9PROT|nr:MFS transporter [Pelagibius litoralis]NIA67834.1 MFS transporter [Pelagibius litoralis]